MAGIIGLKKSKIEQRKEDAVTPEEANILELWERDDKTIRRTRHAIHQTYGKKSPTKARRKLPGKRKWKNKEQQYAVLEGQMTVKSFNNKQRAMHVLDDVYKRQHAARQKHSLVD